MREVPVSEALARKYPEWVVWIITTDAEGAPNIMPAGWAMICNAKPTMMAVSINLGAYTHQSLEETGEFVLAWPGVGHEALIDPLGNCSGREVDKWTDFGLTPAEPSQINVPLLAGCAVALECVVVSQVELEDHSIFVGEVVAAHVSEPPLDKLENFAGTYAVAKPQ